MFELRNRSDYFSTNELWKRCAGKLPCKAAAIAQRCGTTLKRLPPRFPSTVNPMQRIQADRLCSGSELPIANSVICITTGTRMRCDPTITTAEFLVARLYVGEAAAKATSSGLFCFVG